MGLRRLHQNIGGEISKLISSRKLDPGASDCLNSLTKMLVEELDYIEKNVGASPSPESATGSVTIIAGSGSAAAYIYNGMVVVMSAGENTVTFTDAFLAKPVVGVLSCVGQVEGNWVNVNAVIKQADITRTQFKVTVDADCILSYYAVEAN